MKTMKFCVNGIEYSAYHVHNWESYTFRVFARTNVGDAMRADDVKKEEENNEVAQAPVITPYERMMDELDDAYLLRIDTLEPRDVKSNEHYVWATRRNASIETCGKPVAKMSLTGHPGAPKTQRPRKPPIKTPAEQSSTTESKTDDKAERKTEPKPSVWSLRQAQKELNAGYPHMALGCTDANGKHRVVMPNWNDPRVTFGQFELLPGPDKERMRVRHVETSDTYPIASVDAFSCLGPVLVENGYAVYEYDASNPPQYDPLRSPYRPSRMPQSVFDEVVLRTVQNTSLATEGPRLYARLLTQVMKNANYNSSWCNHFIQAEAMNINEAVLTTARTMPLRMHTGIVDQRAGGAFESPLGWYLRCLSEQYVRATDATTLKTDTDNEVRDAMKRRLAKGDAPLTEEQQTMFRKSVRRMVQIRAWLSVAVTATPMVALGAGIAAATIVAGPTVGIVLSTIVGLTAAVCTVFDTINDSKSKLVKSVAGTAGQCF